jgi:hypothetical protein
MVLNQQFIEKFSVIHSLKFRNLHHYFPKFTMLFSVIWSLAQRVLKGGYPEAISRTNAKRRQAYSISVLKKSMKIARGSGMF